MCTRKGAIGSNPILSAYSFVAQLVEQLICNQQVAGSMPVGGSKNVTVAESAQAGVCKTSHTGSNPVGDSKK